MNKPEIDSDGTSVLRITLYLVLVLVSAVLVLSGFKWVENWPSATADGRETLLPVVDQAIATMGNATYSFSGASNDALTTASYKLEGKAWRPIASYPVATRSASAVPDGVRYIYVVNGVGDDSAYQTGMYRYDSVTNSYTQMASNTVGVQKPVLVFTAGKIYKLGGENARGYQTALEIYDIATNTWSLGTPLPSGRKVETAWVRDNRIYTSLCLYDISTNTWSSDIPTSTWLIGDVFVGVGFGNYHVYDNAGNFKETIVAGSALETTGCRFNPTLNKFYATNYDGNKVFVIDDVHPHNLLQTITSGSSNNESVIFDQDGNFYVGHPDGLRQIEKYDPAGNFLAAYSPAVGSRGTDWLDLAADQRTIFYTSEDHIVRRFDLSTNAQLPDFANLFGRMFDLRILPPGDGSGGLLVAHESDILRLDGSNHIIQTYSVPDEITWFSIALDPNGTSFWAVGTNPFPANIYRFNIDTGAIEVGPIYTNPAFHPGGIAVKGEPIAALSGTPTPTPTPTPTLTPTPTPTATPTPTPTTVRVKVQTDPDGLTFSVDGTSYSSRQQFTWTSGSSHTIATTSPQSGGTGTQYVWMNWSDGGAISHSVAPTVNTTYRAKFCAQHFLTMTAGAGGAVLPASGWRNAGQSVTIKARPAQGFTFSGWSGTGTGSYTGTNNPASITMDGPITEAATFTQD